MKDLVALALVCITICVVVASCTMGINDSQNARLEYETKCVDGGGRLDWRNICERGQ